MPGYDLLLPLCIKALNFFYPSFFNFRSIGQVSYIKNCLATELTLISTRSQIQRLKQQKSSILLIEFR